MKNIDIKQWVNSFVFSALICVIDFALKKNTGSFIKTFEGSPSKAILYYLMLFIVVFVICNIVYKKVKKISGK